MVHIPERLAKLKSYSVQPVEEGEIKLDAQENPYSLSEPVMEKIRCSIQKTLLNRYPDPLYERPRGLIASYCGVEAGNILLGNGSDELIFAILVAFGGHGKRAAAPSPTFSMYKILSELTDTAFSDIRMDEGFELPSKELLDLNADIIFITYPNNPTGNLFERDHIEKIISRSEGLVVIDEAYFEFAGKTFAQEAARSENVVVLRTFSKAFSLAGIRAGYAVMNSGLSAELRKSQLPYNISLLNQKILEIALEEKDTILDTVIKLNRSRDIMYKELSRLDGITPYPSDANFILMKMTDVESVLKTLKKDKIAVRAFGDPALADYLRVTVGTEEENNKFMESLKKAI